jgi:hypothetical protein
MAPRTLPNIRHQAGADLQIIGPTAYLGQFFTESSIIPVAAVAPELVTESVDSHVRKRFPGDIGINVAGHTRLTLVGGTESGSNTTPGRRFWCERPEGEGPNRKSNAVQFAYIGTWKALRTFAQANVGGNPYTLRNSSGEKVQITD